MNLVTFTFLRKTSLKFWREGRGRMSGGRPGGGAGLGIGDGGRGCQRRASGGFQEGRVSRGVPDTPG